MREDSHRYLRHSTAYSPASKERTSTNNQEHSIKLVPSSTNIRGLFGFYGMKNKRESFEVKMPVPSSPARALVGYAGYNAP